MNLTLRPVAPETDLARMAEIWNAHVPGFTTVETLQENEQQRPKDFVLQRVAAVDESDRVVGWSIAAHSPFAAAGRWLVRVVVEPAFERQGLGSRLYDEALRFARAGGATRLDSDVRDDLPRGLRYAQQLGFAVDRHLFESVLNVERFAEAPFAAAISAAEGRGIRFSTMAEQGDGPEARRRLYELELSVNRDVPGYSSQGWDLPFERYSQVVFEAPWYKPETQLIALDGDRWVGMCALRYFEENGRRCMYHNITGVLPDQRGMGLALALKVQAVRCARRFGVTEMRTDNYSENAPMLAINRKLGYAPRPGKYNLIKML
ncbi:MAG TPA: GNAT family N-acetyltransferase [Symbiobacteriaceae bacterium]|nr:GNAT family N-acetyltransferase [Symbiobacteriaceae bacterium]